MSVPLEYLEAMADSGCTVEQMLAVLRADRDRRFMAKLRRRMAALVDPEPSPVFTAPKPDSRVRNSASADIIRMAPAKAAAGNGVSTTTILRPAAKVVMLRLLQHLNLDNGRCDPGIARMAAALGLSERSVRRSIAELQAAGLLTRHIHAGRGLSNAYTLDLDAMAALQVPIGRKPDSRNNRTLLAGKPDSGVRQNESQKQPLSVVVEASRARPDPRQRSMFLPIPGNGAILAAEKARQRIHADIADAARAEPSFNVSALTDRDWTAAEAAEVRQRGKGLMLIRERLSRGPPKVASGVN